MRLTTQETIARNNALIERLRHAVREQRIAEQFNHQANIARLVARQLDCGIDRELRRLSRERRVLKMLVREMGE